MDRVSTFYAGWRVPGRHRVEVIVQDMTMPEPGTIVKQPARPLAHVVRHSPDGFEWGYSGSGPSELARCILIDALASKVHPDEYDVVVPPQMYQEFREAHIATITKDTWIIPKADVMAWVDEWTEQRYAQAE